VSQKLSQITATIIVTKVSQKRQKCITKTSKKCYKFGHKKNFWKCLKIPQNIHNWWLYLRKVVFLKYIFVVFLVPFGFLYFFNIFLVIKLSVSFSCHLVFKWRRDSNPRIKTMTKNLTSGGFHQHYMNSFYTRRSQKRIKTVKSSVILCFWDNSRKSCGKKCKGNRPLKLPWLWMSWLFSKYTFGFNV